MRKVRREGGGVFAASPSSASSIDSDTGGSVNSLTPPRPQPRGRRRRPSHANAPPPPAPPRFNSITSNGPFRVLLLLLALVTAFDAAYLWDYFDGLEREDASGPEAGLHRLHSSRRYLPSLLYEKMRSGIATVEREIEDAVDGNDNNDDGKPDPPRADFGYLDGMSDEMKVIELEHEVEGWRDKYERAMARLGENPYAQLAPHTAVPPNMGNDDNDGTTTAAKWGGKSKRKSREELEGEDTHGVDPHIVNILHSANVEIDEELASQLPSWDDVVSLYGEEPIIRGLETCAPYREAVEARDRMTGPAGMFNTGTNLLFELLKSNCDIPEARPMKREPRRNGMRWQVPWGKHNPPSTHRNVNVAKAWGAGIKQDDFFPVVLIKDPYSWMGSQCRHKYTTFWGHDEKHCPNLIRWRIEDEDVPSEVRVKYALQMKLYESLLDMWNRWYVEWEEQTFPHITTRFEDLLFHGENVTRTVCDCVGGKFTDRFVYVEDSAKKAVGVHKGANGLVKAMLQYGDPSRRLTGFTDRDRVYASKTVQADLMRRYGYSAPPLPT